MKHTLIQAISFQCVFSCIVIMIFHLSSGTCLWYNAIIVWRKKGQPCKIGSTITASLGRYTLQSLARVNVWSYQWQLYLHLWTDLIQHHASSTGAWGALPGMPLFVLAGGMSSVFSTLGPIQNPFLSLRGEWHIWWEITKAYQMTQDDRGHKRNSQWKIEECGVEW